MSDEIEQAYDKIGEVAQIGIDLAKRLDEIAEIADVEASDIDHYAKLMRIKRIAEEGG